MSTEEKKEKDYLFMEEGTVCEILNPRPPRYWFNYLWSKNGYCAQVSQMGHGRSYYLNEKADMCMVNNNDARYIYLRDEEDGDCFHIGAGPMNTEAEDFCCEHAISYSKISSVHRGIAGSWRLFVPREGFHEVWTVTLENQSRRARTLSMFSAVTFELEGFPYPRYYEMYRCMETSFERSLNGIYCASSHPFAPHKRYNAFLASSEPVFAWDGDLAKFCGETGSITKTDASAYALFQRPRIVTEGLDCTCSEGALFIMGGVLQHRFTLEPGARKTIQLVLGVSESLSEAVGVRELYLDSERTEAVFRDTKRHDQKKYGSLRVQTPDAKINAIMNEWLKKQMECCIVGKKGVRDNLQIAVGMLNYRQEKAREEILECLRHQFRDGHAVLTWYPYDDTRYSDQPFWIIWAVCELVKETGDFSLLEQHISWQDGGSGTVLEHLHAAAERLLKDKGRNGLIRIFFADWNDALNVTTDPEAESVMLSHQCCMALRELGRLSEKIGDEKYARHMKREYEILRERINEAAWDGDWYLRALSRDEPIGGKESRGSRIYLNAQTWAVLADVAQGEKLAKAVAAVDSMEHDFGFPLNMPPYESYSPHVGRMSGMLPGLFENGGVYCHATGFKILMDCKLGRGSTALRTLKKIMPDSEKNPSSRSGAEPYVFTNCYATHPKYYGKSYWSWTTGTSAWSMMGLYEGILGVQRDYDGLRIMPAFPDEWQQAQVRRHFRGADYHIIFENLGFIGERSSSPAAENNVNIGVAGMPEKAKLQITADGVPIEGNLLPDYRDGKCHEIKVQIFPLQGV